MDILSVLGICVGDIERAEEQCKNALNYCLLSSSVDKLEEVVSDLIECDGFGFSFGDATNSLINYMFEATESLIRDTYPTLEVNYYVNGYDSRFYVKDDDLFEDLHDLGVDAELTKRVFFSTLNSDFGLDSEQILELARANVLEQVVYVVENGGSVELYDSIQQIEELNNLDRSELAELEGTGKYTSKDATYFRFDNGDYMIAGM